MTQQLVQLKSKKDRKTEPAVLPPADVPSTAWIYRQKMKVLWLMISYGWRSKHPWASLRRFLMSVLSPESYRARFKSRLQGECNRCGHCCRLLFDCPFLKQEPGGPAQCTIYMTKHAPKVCVIFPLDPWDLEEIQRAVAPNPCTFSFAPETAAKPSLSRVARLRWSFNRLLRSTQER